MRGARRWAVGAVACVGCVLAIAGDRTRHAPRLLLNTTASAPLGFYAITPGPSAPGQLAVVSPPPDLARWMAGRGYLPANVPLLKDVAAVGGQRVCGLGGAISIDGVAVAQARQHDRWGRRLVAFNGCRRLKSDEVFLLNRAAPQSLDSRYFGPVAADRVVGSAAPLWTWGPSQ
jgi:conjugative transfer signal peptidase TraF